MNQTNERLPQYLYRYLSLKSKDVDRIFTHNEFYFSRPDQFNDPFDCRSFLTLKGCEEDDYKEFLKYNAENSKNKLSEDQINSDIENALKIFRENRALVEGRINNVIKEMLRESIKEFKMLCLSENYKDILMWSHYSDGHRGVVLQLNKKALEKDFKIPVKEVIYPERGYYPSIKDFNNNDHEEIFLKTKSSQWIYEKEWRILKHVENKKEIEMLGKVYTFGKNVITGIILGCNISEPDKDRIYMWREYCEPKPIIYRAIKDKNFYAIKIDPPIET